MSDPETLAIYAAQSDRYANFTDGSTARDPNLTAFIAALPKGGNALDLGCGPGTAPPSWPEAGLDVHAVDAVPEMIALAAKQQACAPK